LRAGLAECDADDVSELGRLLEKFNGLDLQ
jgi:hypothetical protein